MLAKLKSAGAFSLMTVGMLATFALPFLVLGLLFRGAAWMSEHVLPFLADLGGLVFAIDLFILLPLSASRRLRQHTGGWIYLSSYLFGVVTWLFGFILTYALWGAWGVFAGLIFFGVGVVPTAMLATLLKGYWELLFNLVGLAAVTYGTRFVGVRLASSDALRKSAPEITF